MNRMMILALLLLLGSCATAWQQAFHDDMNAQVGTLTIPAAIARFGTPAYERRDPSGETLVTWEWRQATTSSPTGFELGAARWGLTPYQQTTTARAETLILGFGSDGRLRWWRHNW